jgi:3-oxoacyl-[acyl-carrier protein] reductase
MTARMHFENSLKGQVAIVTGGGRNIGRAIAEAYACAGASVVCAARTDSEIEETAEKICAAGGRAIAVRTDVADLDSVVSMTDRAVEAFGGLDILVINAGVHLDRNTVEESDPELWRETVEVNLFGAYHCARAAIPHLKRRGGGKIITLGSGIGHNGSSTRSCYGCSKAGLWMLTRVLAQELWADNISVNELVPGPVSSSMNTGESEVSKIDSEWFKQPEDVTDLALFLAAQPLVGPTAQSFSLMRRDR